MQTALLRILRKYATAKLKDYEIIINNAINNTNMIMQTVIEKLENHKNGKQNKLNYIRFGNLINNYN